MNTLAPNNYPYPITRACTALPHLSAFKELPDGFLRIVLRIVQKINLAKPFSEIFASRITISKESGKSLDSVHRAVKWLEDRDLIDRARKAKIGYRGSKSPLLPTQQFLEALGIVDALGNPTTSGFGSTAKVSTNTSKATTHAESNTDTPGVDVAACSDRQDVPISSSPAVAAGRESPKYVRIGGATLPMDLAWLCDKGVSGFGVLALMREAKAAKQRLSDVLQISKKYLEGLTKREIFAYLSKLIHCGRDFSYLSKEIQTEEKNTEVSEYLARKTDDLEGRSFISKKSGAVFTISDGVIIEIRDGRRSVRFMCESFLEAINNGKLTPHKLGH